MWTVAALALVAALAPVVDPSSIKERQQDSAASREAVVAVFDELLAASEAGDAEAYLSSLANDAVMMYSGQPSVVGKKAIEAFAVDFFERFHFKFAPWQSEEVIVAGTWAFHRYSGIATITPKEGGEPVILDRKYIDILRLEGGSWKVSHHIFNTNR